MRINIAWHFIGSTSPQPANLNAELPHTPPRVPRGRNTGAAWRAGATPLTTAGIGAGCRTKPTVGTGLAAGAPVAPPVEQKTTARSSYRTAHTHVANCADAPLEVQPSKPIGSRAETINRSRKILNFKASHIRTKYLYRDSVMSNQSALILPYL